MGRRWTSSEGSVIREMFFRYDAEEIAAELPGRTPGSVRHRAKALGLRKTPEQRGIIVSLRWNRELEARLGEPICAWLRRRYGEEATYRELTAEAGINTRSLMRLMRECNIEPISNSEAARRLIRDRPEFITNLVAAGNAPEARRKRARTRGANWRAVQSPNERAFMGALNDAGLFPVPEYAVDIYNIDFAFLSVKLAIELDPLWHNTGKKALGDARKDALLISLGWEVLRVESRRSTSFNVRKIELAFRRRASTHPVEVIIG